jgi:putative ABC transport system permease protein
MMNSFSHLVRRVRYLVRRRGLEQEMEEEMRFHLEQRAAEFVADGMSAEEARFAAMRQFGNTASIQERAREVEGWGSLERAWKDVRFGVRQVFRHPGFSALAIVTLALGIGANTSMFSMLNEVLLRPLPYAEPGALDRLYRATAENRRGNFSAADFLELKRNEKAYGELGGYTAASASLSDPGLPADIAYGARCTANLFPLLGVTPVLGRAFRPDEDITGRDRAVILSHRVWQNRYGGRTDIIGRTIRVDGEPHEVIGVLPQSFNDWRFLGVIDFFRPLALIASDRQDFSLRVIGRRSDAVSFAEAAGFVSGFGDRMAREYPEANAAATWHLMPLQRSVAGTGAHTVVPMVIGLSAFVLLIACSNLANLLLARTLARAREFAVRAALGASRTQLLRPLIAEALVLACSGGALALLVATWFRDWAERRSRGENGEAVVFAIDWNVAAWAFGVALVTALVFGIGPALFALRLDINETLKSGGRGITTGRGQKRFRQMLIVLQFALAMVLLTGAGLFIRGLHDTNSRREGWNSETVVTGATFLPPGKYPNAERMAAFHREMIAKLQAVPGVSLAAVSTASPFWDWSDVRRILVQDHPQPEPGREPSAAMNVVSPQYFDAYRTRLLAGRFFDGRDETGSPPVYIVSEKTARAMGRPGSGRQAARRAGYRCPGMGRGGWRGSGRDSSRRRAGFGRAPDLPATRAGAHPRQRDRRSG